MNQNQSLTTVQAAGLAGVAPSTVKRWADEGLIPTIRTIGGHRRFERAAFYQWLTQHGAQLASGPTLQVSPWLDCLLSGDRVQIESRLLAARARLGHWYLVADEIGLVLGELGQNWQYGKLSIAHEHAISERLERALTRIADHLPGSTSAPCCVLATLDDEDHTLGLSLAELCLREAGWQVLWLGRRTPLDALTTLLKSDEPQTMTIKMLALSASVLNQNAAQLCNATQKLARICRKQDIRILLGGSGAWPTHIADTHRVRSFTEFSQYLHNP